MINAHMKNRESAPVWAILGAPLLGIPLLIALLALAHPRAEATEADTESMVTIEQIEQIDEHGVGAPTPCDPSTSGVYATSAVHVKNG